MKPILPLLLCDFYKVGHVFQYPANTTKIYSNFTPRKSRIPGVDYTVFVGLQYFIKEYLIEQFNQNFFAKPKKEVLAQYKRRIETALGKDAITFKHIEALHDLGYLPIKIKALKEGTVVPMKVPVLTVTNTVAEFYWLPNFLETILSTTLWQSCTSATYAYEFKKLLDGYAKETTGETSFVPWQGHDFSMRGMSSLESACLSGLGHLLSFSGTDTIPAIDFAENYYNADADKELIGGSVAATEHSVMCMGTKDDEIATFRRLIKEVYPTGIVSIVSDTWDLWKVLTEYMPELREEILARDGKVVIRPDSGDPVDIICGVKSFAKESDYIGRKLGEHTGIVPYGESYLKYQNGTCVGFAPEHKGVIELLWEAFGGTINAQGYKVLNPKVGAIYGDSINLARAKEICDRLKAKGFASTNIVFGIGSYTYQYNTRDTQGWAMKATYGELYVTPCKDAKKCLENEIIGEETDICSDGCVQAYTEKREIFKDPITDDGTKKSLKGLLRVEEIDVYAADGYGKLHKTGTSLTVKDQIDWKQEAGGLLETVFEDGKLVRDQSLSEIRQLLGAL